MFQNYFRVDPMIGTIVAYPSNTLPDGLLACDGSTHNRIDYPDLYTRLDAQYQADSDTFTLPDMRDRFIVGIGGYSVGDVGGVDSVALTVPELPAHSHSYIPPIANVDLETPGVPDILAAGVGIPTNTGSVGGNQAHENRPPYYALQWAIIAR